MLLHICFIDNLYSHLQLCLSVNGVSVTKNFWFLALGGWCLSHIFLFEITLASGQPCKKHLQITFTHDYLKKSPPKKKIKFGHGLLISEPKTKEVKNHLGVEVNKFGRKRKGELLVKENLLLKTMNDTRGIVNVGYFVMCLGGLFVCFLQPLLWFYIFIHANLHKIIMCSLHVWIIYFWNTSNFIHYT